MQDFGAFSKMLRSQKGGVGVFIWDILRPEGRAVSKIHAHCRRKNIFGQCGRVTPACHRQEGGGRPFGYPLQSGHPRGEGHQIPQGEHGPGLWRATPPLPSGRNCHDPQHDDGDEFHRQRLSLARRRQCDPTRQRIPGQRLPLAGPPGARSGGSSGRNRPGRFRTTRY